MRRLPQLKGAEVVRAFEKAGWHVRGQRGSHCVLTKEGQFFSLAIPMQDQVKQGLLHSLIRKADLTVEEFLDLL